MAGAQGATVRRRRLASELRRLREAAKLTIEDVATKLECSTSKISRVETGRVGVTARDVRDMLDLYQIDDHLREELMQLAREARNPGWWHAYNEVLTGAFVGLEAEASSLHAFQALLVPGLLQTQRYAAHVIRAMRLDATDEEIHRRVEARMIRQQVFTQTSPPEYHAIIDEAVLCRVIGGPEVMAEQYQKILELTKLPQVTIQILPFHAGAHAGMDGPFVILSFPDPADHDVVYVDSSASGIYLELSPEIERFRVMFAHLRAKALTPAATVSLIAEYRGRCLSPG